MRPAFDVRYVGQAFELTVRSEPEPDAIRNAFDKAHEERYGFTDPDTDIELVTVRVSFAQPGSPLPREEPADSDQIRGPALRRAMETTVVIPDGWTGWVDNNGTWLLEREA